MQRAAFCGALDLPILQFLSTVKLSTKNTSRPASLKGVNASRTASFDSIGKRLQQFLDLLKMQRSASKPSIQCSTGFEITATVTYNVVAMEVMRQAISVIAHPLGKHDSSKFKLISTSWIQRSFKPVSRVHGSCLLRKATASTSSSGVYI